MRVSIICCYNRPKQLQCFLDSVEKQDEKAQLILIDNTRNQFSSNAAAYNDGLKKVTSEYVIFSHQDILLTKTDMLRRFTDYLTQVKCGDIVGVAGAKAGTDGVFTSITDEKGRPYGKDPVTGMMACDTVDECFFGGRTETFLRFPFDEVLCSSWHLYAVERCLNALERGSKVYVCDVPVVHTSKGHIDHAYNVGFYKISKRYAKSIGYIKTTCAYASTKAGQREWAYLKREFSILTGRYERQWKKRNRS